MPLKKTGTSTAKGSKAAVKAKPMKKAGIPEPVKAVYRKDAFVKTKIY